VDFSFPKKIENLDTNNIFYQSYNVNNVGKVEKFSSQVGFHFQDTAKMFIKTGDFPILESVSVPRVECKLNEEKFQQCQTRLARRILKYKKSRMSMNSSSPSVSNSNDPMVKLIDDVDFKLSDNFISTSSEMEYHNRKRYKHLRQPISESERQTSRDYVRKLLSPAETVPAKLKADGISVFYSTNPPPSLRGHSLSDGSSTNLSFSCEEDSNSRHNFWSSSSFDGSSVSTNLSTEKPVGKVDIDSRIDFSPQVIQDEDYHSTSPAYSNLYDDFGNSLVHARPYLNSSDEQPQDDYPSSWDYVDSKDKINKQNTQKVRIISANVWSDPGISFHSSSETFCKLDRFRPVKVSRLMLNQDESDKKPKCASDSNLQDAVIMMEPGLRRIRKESYATTASFSTSHENFSQYEPSEENCRCVSYQPNNVATYGSSRDLNPDEGFQQRAFIEESGFFSNPWECEGQDLSWDQYDHQLPNCLCNGQSRSYFCLHHHEENYSVQGQNHYFQPAGNVQFVENYSAREPHWVKNLCDSSLSFDMNSFSQFNTSDNSTRIMNDAQDYFQEDHPYPIGNVS